MIYVICNPVAGSGHGEKIGLRVKEKLTEKGYPFQLFMTEYPGHATELARQAVRDGADTVLSIGGDGTGLETARGLLHSEVSLGIIPAGTGNDFIKTLGIPKDPMEALEYILSRDSARPTDAGEINGQLFLNEVGTGFDVSVLDYALKAKKFCRGLLPYLYGVIRTVFRFKGITLTLSRQGGEPEKREAFVIGAANGGVFGGGITIAPDASVDDGLLDMVLIGKIKARHLPARLAGLLKGKVLTFPETEFVRVSELSFSCPGMRVNVDGEIIPADRADIRLLPGALRILR